MGRNVENFGDWQHVWMENSRASAWVQAAFTLCRHATCILKCQLHETTGRNRAYGRDAIIVSPLFLHEIDVVNEYQNEYQSDSKRYVRIETDTSSFLRKIQKNAPKTGQKCPIPTLASSRLEILADTTGH